jgi:Flp pilus assembly protein TadG
MAAGVGDDTGGAVVETALVTVVLMALFLAMLQLGLVLHVRNTLVACAAEGARYGANADRDAADAVAHARQLIRGALADGYADDVQAQVVDAGGLLTMEVTVSARLPVVGLLGPPRALTVRGHALEEAGP